jgi:hypothetical protein
MYKETFSASPGFAVELFFAIKNIYLSKGTTLNHENCSKAIKYWKKAGFLSPNTIYIPAAMKFYGSLIVPQLPGL